LAAISLGKPAQEGYLLLIGKRLNSVLDLPKGPRKNNCMIPGVTQSMSCTISLLSRGFHILPTAYKQSCSILL
jgi:hypothetical protein